MVDVADSKSADGDIVWVRVPPPAYKDGRSTVRLTCRLCICDKGLEGSGSEWTAGGSPEPRPGSPAGEESHHRHGVRRSKHRSVSVLRRKLHYVSSFFLFRIEPTALGFDLDFCCKRLILFMNCVSSFFLFRIEPAALGFNSGIMREIGTIRSSAAAGGVRSTDGVVFPF